MYLACSGVGCSVMEDMMMDSLHLAFSVKTEESVVINTNHMKNSCVIQAVFMNAKIMR